MRDLYDVGIAMTQPKAPLSTITAEKDLFQGSTTSLPPAIYHKADVWESVIADGCALFVSLNTWPRWFQYFTSPSGLLGFKSIHRTLNSD